MAAAGLFSSLKQLRSYLRSRGLAATLARFRTAFLFSREHYVLVYKPMDVEVPRVEARISGCCRLAELSDLPQLDVFSDQYTQEQFREWIEQGGVLFVFDHEGRIIAYRLITRQIPRVGAATKIIRLEATDTWVANTYTLPEFRGGRIGSALTSHVLIANKAAGYKREISLIRLANEASRKMVGLAGAVEIEEITYTVVCGLKLYKRRPAHQRRYYSGENATQSNS
ncbi:MAG: GNAT family N-acetyltransferase [Deltaproteobacteria bacterium]|nr:GNAT family N-acetyltransferase [Deltaproteobacteria bacterium]